MSVNQRKREPNVQVRVFDTDVLRFLFPEWDTLEKSEKLTLIRNIGEEEKRRIAVHNVTCVGLHKMLAYLINPEESAGDEGSEIAFGTDSSTISSSDTSLNSEVGRVDLSDVSTNESNNETVFTGFVDSSEMNGYTLAEIGLYSTKGELFNHAAISPTIDKTSTETVVADISLSFSN